MHVNPNLVMLLISVKLTMRVFPLSYDFSVIFDSSDIGPKSLIYHYSYRLNIKTVQKWFDLDIQYHLKCLRAMRRKFKAHPSSQKVIADVQITISYFALMFNSVSFFFSLLMYLFHI